MQPDLWFQVVQFMERPPALQAFSSVCKQFGALVKSRQCWGSALRPLFEGPHCSAKELRLACDWAVIRQLPETFHDARQIFVAGSFALHEVLVRRGRPPRWYPRDIDVWLVNSSSCMELGHLLAGRLAALGLHVDATPGCGDYVTDDRMDYKRNGNNQDSIRGLEPGSCVITRVYDLRYSLHGLHLGTLSLIGTRPADPIYGVRTRPPRPPDPLTVYSVMANFDVDVCRVGVLPPGKLVFCDAAAFDLSLKTMRAHQKRRGRASEAEAMREAGRLLKYERRGFRF